MACSVTAKLFQQPYLISDQLAGSLMCVTFGQPLISMQEIKETAHQLPLFKSVLHCIYAENDVLPQLMRYTELQLTGFSDDEPQVRCTIDNTVQVDMQRARILQSGVRQSLHRVTRTFTNIYKK